MGIVNYAKQYTGELKQSLDQVPWEQVNQIVAIIDQARQDGRRIYVMGNGGSAATASHFVCDLAKGSRRAKEKPFKIISLADNVPSVTAWANDQAYDDIFKEQLVTYLEKEDVVIAFTGSGNSKNILNAIEYANTAGAMTIAVTGFDGGKVKQLAKDCLVVPSDNMERIEDIHLILTHVIHSAFCFAQQGSKNICVTD